MNRFYEKCSTEHKCSRGKLKGSFKYYKYFPKNSDSVKAAFTLKVLG